MAAQTDYEAVRKELEQLRADMAALTNTLKGIAAEQGSAAYERVRRSADRAQEHHR